MNSFQNKAIRIAEEAVQNLNLRPGEREVAVARRIKKIFKKLGAKKESFRTIVASGKRSRLVHGYATKKVIRSHDVVMVDLGACYRGQCSDLTRTFFLAEPTKLQKKDLRAGFESAGGGDKKSESGGAVQRYR